MENEIIFGEKIKINSEEEFYNFLNYWKSISSSNKKTKKNIKIEYVVCGKQDFLCGSNKGECKI